MDHQEKDDYKDILFGYSCVPSCGFYGEDDGGFSVAVYADGRLVHKTYIFYDIDKTTAEYKISDTSVSKIKKLMEKYQTDIDAFDEHLNNGSCDGSGNFFVFNGKQIITWNITCVGKGELWKIYRHDLNKHLSVEKQETGIIFLFVAVTKILKSDGVTLDLHEVNFS